MQNLTRLSIVILAASTISFAVPNATYADVVLITEQEARFPPAKNQKPDSRAITRGPRIAVILEPTVRSPFHLQIKFQSFGAAKIDMELLRVTLLKTPTVDLTSRVSRFAQIDGIDIPDAVSPVGQYDIRVEVMDTEGRAVTRTFELKVDP